MTSACQVKVPYHPGTSEVNKAGGARASDGRHNESILHFRPGEEGMSLRFYCVCFEWEERTKNMVVVLRGVYIPGFSTYLAKWENQRDYDFQ